jgi:hypothetical protein
MCRSALDLEEVPARSIRMRERSCHGGAVLARVLPARAGATGLPPTHRPPAAFYFFCRLAAKNFAASASASWFTFAS